MGRKMFLCLFLLSLIAVSCSVHQPEIISQPKIELTVPNAASASNMTFSMQIVLHNSGEGTAVGIQTMCYLFNSFSQNIDIVIDSSTLIPQTLESGKTVLNTTTGHSTSGIPAFYQVSVDYSSEDGKAKNETVSGPFVIQ